MLVELAPLWLTQVMDNQTMTVVGGLAATALFAFGVVLFVLFIVRRVHAAAFAKLEPEGVIRRSGRVRIYLKLRGYSGPRVTHSSATSIRTGELVLTKKGLVLLMPYTIRLGAPPWGALTTDVREGKLHLLTEAPPEATGKVEVTAHVPDAATWLPALRA